MPQSLPISCQRFVSRWPIDYVRHASRRWQINTVSFVAFAIQKSVSVKTAVVC